MKKEKKFSPKVQETIDLLKSAVASEAKKATPKKQNLSFEKPKWKRINYEVKGVSKIYEFNNVIIKGLDSENILVNSDVEVGMRLSNYFKNESEKYSNVRKNIQINKGKKENIFIEFNVDKNNSTLVDVFNIHMNKGSDARIFIKYNGIDEEYTYHNGYIKIIAEEESKLDIFVMQNLNLNSENFLSMDIDVKRDADVKYYGIELGGEVNVTSVSSNLLEDDSKSLLMPIYLSDKERKTDYEYTLNFFGKRTIADIDARGVTKDKAVKVFRGNLVFERFSTKSEGSESEFSILLDKTVNAHSIPTLFCDEDDVIGAHSASIGKIDQDKLFYLMSRGFSEKAAKKLVVESSFGPVFDAIEDEKTVEEIKEIIGRRI